MRQQGDSEVRSDRFYKETRFTNGLQSNKIVAERQAELQVMMIGYGKVMKESWRLTEPSASGVGIAE